MPNRRTVFLKDNFYHVFNRGNRKEPIFLDINSYQRFLEKVERYRKRYAVDVVAYCLMRNHFHLVLKQLAEIPVSKFIGVLLNSHSHYSSLKFHLPAGHFFQGRFGSKLIETPESLLQVSRYLHLNPVKEKILGLDFTYKTNRLLERRKSIIKSLRNYPWSSYPTYLSKNLSDKVFVNQSYLLELQSRSNYRKFVESKITDEDLLDFEAF